MPQQFDDRQVGRCATVGAAVGLQNQPTRHVVRANELIQQARFAQSRFANDRNNLTLAVTREALSTAKLL